MYPPAAASLLRTRFGHDAFAVREVGFGATGCSARGPARRVGEGEPRPLPRPPLAVTGGVSGHSSTRTPLPFGSTSTPTLRPAIRRPRARSVPTGDGLSGWSSVRPSGAWAAGRSSPPGRRRRRPPRPPLGQHVAPVVLPHLVLDVVQPAMDMLAECTRAQVVTRRGPIRRRPARMQKAGLNVRLRPADMRWRRSGSPGWAARRSAHGRRGSSGEAPLATDP